MSLINQMLKDLEARQSPKDSQGDSPLKGLATGRKQKKPKVSKKFWFIIGPVFVIVLMVLLSPSDDDKKKLPPEIASASTKQTSPATDQQALFEALVSGQQPAANAGSATVSPSVQALGVQKSIMGTSFEEKNGEGFVAFKLQDAQHNYEFIQSETKKLARVLFFMIQKFQTMLFKV